MHAVLELSVKPFYGFPSTLRIIAVSLDVEMDWPEKI